MFFTTKPRRSAECRTQSAEILLRLKKSLRSALCSLRFAQPFSVHLFGFSGLLRICCYFGRNDRHRRQNIDRAGMNVDQIWMNVDRAGLNVDQIWMNDDRAGMNVDPIWMNDDRAGMNVEPGAISFGTQNKISGTESGIFHHEGHEEPRRFLISRRGR